MELIIEYVPIDTIKPYKSNAKRHPKKQIKQIAESIKEIGFADPIGVWNNEIVEGHGRYLAAQELGMGNVPIIRLDALTDTQRKAYTLIHNKLTMSSGFDIELLNAEISELDFDLQQFDFKLDLDFHEENKEHTKELVRDIVNLEKGQFIGIGKYDIPILEPVTKLGKIKEWISFNYVLSDENPEGKAVHFFIDDYQFERLWNNPEKYVDKLKQYVCVATPDFSPYGDMPHALQIYNHYRKHWVGAYLQSRGVTVIPTIRCSTDERSLEWYLDGEPKGGTVIISSMWTSDESIKDMAIKEYTTMRDTLKPNKIFVYVRDTGNMGISKKDPIEFIQNFTDRRWNNAKR